MTKYCSNCGRAVNDNRDYCPDCGWELEKNHFSNNDKNKQTNNINAFAIIALLLSFLAPLAGLVFSIVGIIYAKNNKNSGMVISIVALVISIMILMFYALIGAILWYIF